MLAFCLTISKLGNFLTIHVYILQTGKPFTFDGQASKDPNTNRMIVRITVRYPDGRKFDVVGYSNDPGTSPTFTVNGQAVVKPSNYLHVLTFSNFLFSQKNIMKVFSFNKLELSICGHLIPI